MLVDFSPSVVSTSGRCGVCRCQHVESALVGPR